LEPPLSAYRIRTPSTVRNRTSGISVEGMRHHLGIRAMFCERAVGDVAPPHRLEGEQVVGRVELVAESRARSRPRQRCGRRHRVGAADPPGARVATFLRRPASRSLRPLSAPRRPPNIG
jgi:hypothetical protein